MENIEVKDINQKNIIKILEDRGMTQFRVERRPHTYLLDNENSVMYYN